MFTLYSAVAFAQLVFGSLLSRAVEAFAWLLRRSDVVHKIAKRADRRRTCPPGLPAVGPWEKLSERVTLITGLNPGTHTLQGTNTYLVGLGRSRILIDTGEGCEGYIPLLRHVMGAIGCQDISYILLTHCHADHAGGVLDIWREFDRRIPVVKKRAAHEELFAYGDLQEGQLFSTEGATLRAVATPGHTPDHFAFVLEEEGALFSGDMVLGCGTAVFDDFATYMASLQRTLAICATEPRDDRPAAAAAATAAAANAANASGAATHDGEEASSGAVNGNGNAAAAAEQPVSSSNGNSSSSNSNNNGGGGIRRIYPGHGPKLEDARAAIAGYISHREQREAQIVQALEQQAALAGSAQRAMPSLLLTYKIYGWLLPPLFLSAHHNVLQHLNKLAREGRAEPVSWLPGAWRILAAL